LLNGCGNQLFFSLLLIVSKKKLPVPSLRSALISIL
jgi:hypothetical protein